jgi:hypothetical protein
VSPSDIRHDELVWLPANAIALEYNRSPRLIRVWCTNGFLIELGYRVRRDETGHWIVGVPLPKFEAFEKKAEISATAL